MKQTAVEWLFEEINQQQKIYIDLAKKDKSLKKGVDAILTATTILKMKCEQAKEMEKQQQGYSEEDMRKSYAMGWITRERFDDLSPDIIYPKGIDYEEKQDYAFNLWFEKFKNK